MISGGVKDKMSGDETWDGLGFFYKPNISALLGWAISARILSQDGSLNQKQGSKLAVKQVIVFADRIIAYMIYQEFALCALHMIWLNGK